jgi:hypothetical protein
MLGEYNGVSSVSASPNGSACTATGTTSTGVSYSPTTDAANAWIVAGSSIVNTTQSPSSGIMRQQVTTNPQTAIVDTYNATPGTATIATACDTSCTSQSYAVACVELKVASATPGFDKRRKLQRLGVLSMFVVPSHPF